MSRPRRARRLYRVTTRLHRLIAPAVLALLLLPGSGGLLADSAPDAFDSPPPAITVQSIQTLAYTYPSIPTALGPIDAVSFSTPFWVLDMELKTEAGLHVAVVSEWVSEYDRLDQFSIPWGDPGNRIASENNTFTTSFLAFPTFFGRMSLGRQHVSFGPSNLSNLLVAQDVPFLDSIVLEIPMGRWTAHQAIATLENRRAVGDLQVDFARAGYNYGITLIVLSSRRFVWAGDTIDLGIGTQVVLSRPYNAYQLGDVLPIYSPHNSDVGVTNTSLALDAKLTRWPAAEPYLIVGVDDINGNVLGISDTEIPTMWGVVAGVTGTLPLGQGSLQYDTEFVGTHYLWGSYIDSWALSKSIYRLHTDGGNLILPLSSPYGPGRLSWTTRLMLDLTRTLSGELHLLLLAGDPSVDLVSTPYATGDFTPEFLLFRTDARADYEPLPGLLISGSLGIDILPDQVLPRAKVAVSYTIGLTRPRQ